jgi:hypothetical protein
LVGRLRACRSMASAVTIAASALKKKPIPCLIFPAPGGQRITSVARARGRGGSLAARALVVRRQVDVRELAAWQSAGRGAAPRPPPSGRLSLVL